MICRCRRRRLTGSRYMGEELCRCGGVTSPAVLSRLWFTEALIPELGKFRVRVFKAAGLRWPSHYKGLGGSLTIEPDEPLRHLAVGYVEGEERLLLANRLGSLQDEVPEVMKLISLLEGSS